MLDSSQCRPPTTGLIINERSEVGGDRAAAFDVSGRSRECLIDPTCHGRTSSPSGESATCSWSDVQLACPRRGPRIVQLPGRTDLDGKMLEDCKKMYQIRVSVLDKTKVCA